MAPVAVGLAVVAAALAVIVWLPLDAEVEADVKEALVGYEVARDVAWPASRPISLPLPSAQRAALVEETGRGLSRYASGDALDDFDASQAVRRFETAAMTDAPWVVTKWAGEVVHFDFVRQSLRGAVIVRAGVHRTHQIGRMSDLKQRIVARRWVWDDGADIYEYTLHDDGESWKVVAAEHWGVCGPDGENVVEGGEGL
jgi:hypothetical protein